MSHVEKMPKNMCEIELVILFQWLLKIILFDSFINVKKEGLEKNRLIFRWDPSHVYTKIMERSRGRWCMTDFLSTYLTSSREQHFSTATLLKEKKLHDFIKLIIISNVSFIYFQSLLRISLGWKTERRYNAVMLH